MTVASTHLLHDKNMPIWKKCRDCVSGEEDVKAGGQLYLPKLEEQADGDYKAYVQRAMFFGAAGRTVEGLSGMVTRKKPVVEVPEQMTELLTKIGIGGETLEQIINMVLKEVISLGRVGLMVDAPTEADAQPYIASYYAENIINWRTEKIDGRMMLTLLVLEEYAELPGNSAELSESEREGKDEYDIVCQKRYRVLRLDLPANATPGAKRVYTVEVWKETRNEVKDNQPTTTVEKIGETVTPKLKGGKTLEMIPFTFVTPTGITAEIEKSPINDLVDVNLSHYRTSADLEHGRHFTALPTAYAVGFESKSSQLRIGSGVAWVSENPNAKCGFLEFTGAGLGHLQTAMDSKQKMMAVLGGRLLEEQKREAEAAATVKMRQSGEQSVLANIATATEAGVVQALKWVAEWLGLDSSKITVQLNKTYVVEGMAADLLIALMQAVDTRKMSWDNFFELCKSRELFPEDRTADDERAAIDDNPAGSTPDITQPNNTGSQGGGSGGGQGGNPNAGGAGNQAA